MRQCGIRRFQRDIRPTPHRDTNRGGLHRWRIVNAVTYHRQRRLLIQHGDRLHFIFRQQPGVKRQTQFASNGGRCARVIASQDHAVHTQRVQFADGSASIVAQRILQGDDADHGLVAQDQNDRLPGTFKLVNFSGKGVGRTFTGSANQNAFAIHLCFNT